MKLTHYIEGEWLAPNTQFARSSASSEMRAGYILRHLALHRHGLTPMRSCTQLETVYAG